MFFTENSLISQNQSGFKPGDSCTNQLLSIMNQIYKSFDDGHEVWSVFFKVKQNDISGNLLSTLPHKKVSRDLTEKKQDVTEMSIVLMVLTEI